MSFWKGWSTLSHLLIWWLFQSLSPGNSGRMGAWSVNCSEHQVHLYFLVKDRRHLLDIFLSSDNQIFHDGLCCNTSSDAFGETVLQLTFEEVVLGFGWDVLLPKFYPFLSDTASWMEITYFALAAYSHVPFWAKGRVAYQWVFNFLRFVA